MRELFNIFHWLTIRFNRLLLLCVINLMAVASVWAFELSNDEKQYIQGRAPVTMCVDPDWLPFEKIDANGRHIGIAADYFKLFSEMTGLQFKLVVTESWAQSEAFAKNGQCEILSLLNKSKEREEYLDFTVPYLSSPVVLVSNIESSYIAGLSTQAGKTLSMVTGYVYQELVARDFPDIQIIEVSNSDETLLSVSEGRVDLTMGSLYIITDRIQRLGLSNIKIAGPTQYKNEFRVGVNKSDVMLLQVLDKAVAALSPKNETEIISRWVKVKYDHGQDYSLAFQIGIFSLFVFCIVGYRAFVLSRYNVKLNEAYALLEKKNQELDRISHTDPLTHIYNRLHLDETITYEVNRSKRYRTQMSVILLDIDHFKHVNDEYGHPIGDRVLIELCRLVKQQLRVTDIFGRWGGEEFLVVCPDTGVQEAVIIAEKLRRSIEEAYIDPVSHITVSFGVTDLREEDGEKELISRADRHLYRAKNEGRNRVCHD